MICMSSISFVCFLAHRLGDVSGMQRHHKRKHVDSIIHVARSRHSSSASQASSVVSASIPPEKLTKKDSKKFRKASKTKMVIDHTPHEVCLGAFVKRVNWGHYHTQYTSTGDIPAIGDIPSSKKALKLSKGECTTPLEGARIHY